jgi:signal peptidase I
MKEKARTKHSAGHRIITVIGIILCVILIPIIIINCTLILKQFINKDKVPSVGGIFPMIVLTDSMQGTFDSGSLIICKTTDPADVEAGDIICFYDPTGSGTTTVTHRVARVETDEDGTLSFITKGDANNAEDTSPVPAENLVGVYQFHIDGLGSFAMFMQTTQGLILFIALPVLLLIGYDTIRRRIYEKQKDSDTDALMAELEALRAEKAAQEAVSDIAGTSADEDEWQ